MERGSGRVTSRWVPSGNIRDTLSAEAAAITEATTRRLASVSASAWRRAESGLRLQWCEMLGLDACWGLPRRAPSVVVTGVLERGSYRIEKLHYEAWPKLYLTANLYVPRGVTGRLPAVLYVSGHARDPKSHYQAHARRFAELGFVCLIVDTVQLGEIPGYHHGCYREGWWHWYSRGYTPAGIETLSAVRGLDLLTARPEVDPERLGITGISGGGVTSWWAAALDERIRVAAPVCGTATLYSQVHDRTIDGHCDCIWWTNTRRWDLGDVGALIAPRPLLIASADKDGIFTVESIRQVHAQVAPLYRKLGARENLKLVETPGGHSYHERSRTEIFAWFARHLQGREVSAAEIGDLELDPAKLERPEALRVFGVGLPADACNPRVQDELLPAVGAPHLSDAEALRTHRSRVVTFLREHTFGGFPTRPVPLDVQVEYEFDEDAAGYRFGFTSEPGWRLSAQMLYRKPLSTPAPVMLGLRLPGEGRGDTRSFLLGLRAPGARVAVEVRGTGDTSWGEDLNWHVRRAAAWTGRTVASMRVWDVLRAVEAVRGLPGIDATRISLAARGEMAVVALYAALLDGRIESVVLSDPPATQDAPGEKDGRGAALEMLSCLRVTDVAQVAGLLFPTRLVLAGAVPETFQWPEALYRRLGPPGRITRVSRLSDWEGS
ncbi:MAG: acetylxylan esterase [Verrucomicrobiales bacterium]|nr:acetylxylan esterase [Verrucomicrobiales bacterium]